MTRRARVVGHGITAVVFCLFSWVAFPQSYPTKPVRVLIGFSPGSSTDMVMRLIAPKLTEAWSQPVVVDNRAGAGGNIAADTVAKANPDGYTLLFANGGIAISPSLYKTQPYNARTDLLPVTLVTLMPHMMCANPSLPVKTVSDFVNLARSSPGKVLFSSAGIGNSDHMAAELLGYMANIKMTHVPNKGGPQALNDVISGQVAMTFPAISTCLPQARAGKARALAVTSAKRSAVAPDVPTMQEAGVAGYEHTLWYGLFAPAKTSPAVVDKLSSDIARVIAVNDLRERFTALGIETVGSSPAEFSRFFVSELNKWPKVVKAAGIEAQ